MSHLQDRLRNKIFALEKQNMTFHNRIQGFIKAPLWKRLMMAWAKEI